MFGAPSSMPKKKENKMKRSSDEIINRMIQLAGNKYNCSQITMLLAIEKEEHVNPGLIRAMSGLGDGCGFFNETCGGHDKRSQRACLVWRQRV
jgi:hypothetical protein